MTSKHKTNTRGAINPTRAARIRARIAEGATDSAIAREEGVSRTAVGAFRKRKRLGRTATPTPANAAPSATVAPPSAADSHGAVDVERRLASVTATLDKMEPGLLTGDVPAPTYGTLVKIETELAERAEAMRPRAAEEDPMVAIFCKEAEQKIVRELARVTAIAEEKMRCPHCNGLVHQKGS